MKVYCDSCGQPIYLSKGTFWHQDSPLFQRHYARPRDAAYQNSAQRGPALDASTEGLRRLAGSR